MTLIEDHVDGRCFDRLCPFASSHREADQRWCEPHGEWKIGNPCPVEGQDQEVGE